MKEELTDAVLCGWERDWGLLVGLVVDDFDHVVEVLLVGFGDLHWGGEGKCLGEEDNIIEVLKFLGFYF